MKDHLLNKGELEIIMNSRYESFLSGIATWAETPQGHKYWANLESMIRLGNVKISEVGQEVGVCSGKRIGNVIM